MPDEATNLFLASLTPGPGMTFLGARRDPDTGKFSWTDRSPWSFQSWDTSSPGKGGSEISRNTICGESTCWQESIKTKDTMINGHFNFVALLEIEIETLAIF